MRHNSTSGGAQFLTFHKYDVQWRICTCQTSDLDIRIGPEFPYPYPCLWIIIIIIFYHLLNCTQNKQLTNSQQKSGVFPSSTETRGRVCVRAHLLQLVVQFSVILRLFTGGEALLNRLACLHFKRNPVSTPYRETGFRGSRFWENCAWGLSK